MGGATGGRAAPTPYTVAKRQRSARLAHAGEELGVIVDGRRRDGVELSRGGGAVTKVTTISVTTPAMAPQTAYPRAAWPASWDGQ